MPEHAIVDPATVKYHFWVYLLFFFDDEDPSYVGVTDDFVKRMDDHNDVRGGAPRVAVARSAYGAFRAKIAAALYCTLLEAKALETYLMKKYNTKLQETRERIEARLHEQNPDRLAWPDIALYPLVPKSKQLNCIHSRNYMKFAAEVDAAGAAYERGETPPPKLTPEQHTQFLAQIENDWRGTVWATDGAEDSCSLVFEVDSPFARARELKEQYEEMAPHALVDRNVVSGQLLTLRQYSLGDEDADKEVQLMTKLWQKSVHPNNEALVAKPITAGYAAALFSVAYQWCGEHEEALLLAQAGIDADTDEAPAGNPGYASAEALKRRAILQGLQWRKWSEAHDGKQPRHTGKTAAVKPEEATLKDAINEALRDWVANCENTHYLLGSALGPHPYPTIVRELQSVIGHQDRRDVFLWHAKAHEIEERGKREARHGIHFPFRQHGLAGRKAHRLHGHLGRINARRIGKGRDPVGGLLRQKHEGVGVAAKAHQRVLGFQLSRHTTRDGQQDAVAGRQPDGIIDLLETVEIEDDHRRTSKPLGTRTCECRGKPVHEQFAVRKAGQVIVNGVMQETLLGDLLLGDVEQRPDTADHLAIGAHDGAGAQAEPAIVAILGAQAECL